MSSISVAERLDRTVRALTRLAERQPTPWRRLFVRALDLPIRAVWHAWRNRRYLTVYKLLNMMVVNVESLLCRRRLIGLPYDIKVEVTNICNTSCQLCPTGRGLQGRIKGKMSFDRFRRVIDQIRRHTYTLDLSNWGDPLIVPEIYRMIRYAHQAGIWTYLSTNLHAFKADSEQAKKLVQSGLDMLNVSLHGASEETYQAYQPGKSLQQVLHKLRLIVEAKRQLRSRTPAIRLFFVVTSRNEHEIDAFRTLARRLGCEAVFSWASLNLRFVGCGQSLEDLGWSRQQKRQRIEELKKRWLPSNSRWVAPWYRQPNHGVGKTDPTKKPKIYPCDWPWKRTVINWDGSVAVCCGVFNPKWDMGNVFQTPLKDIWNNDAYQAARRSFKTAAPGGPPQPCGSCIGVMV